MGDLELPDGLRDELRGAWHRYIDLLAPLRPALHGYCRRLSGNLWDAEDLVQETLLRAFQHLADFVPRCDGAFLLYLRRILVNLVRDLARREKRAPRPDALEVDPPGGAPTPVEEAVGRETWERYREAVERLSEKQEQAVVLFVECGMEFPEIAQAIGSPSGHAARMVVARGLERLAELMHERR